MTYILDTCVLSEIIKPLPNQAVVRWLESQDSQRLYVSALTIGELRKGIERLESGEKKHRLLLWFCQLTEQYGNRILYFDTETALTWGSMCALNERNGFPLSVIDGMIAATALRNACILVTRNEHDYKNTGVTLLNPWN